MRKLLMTYLDKDSGTQYNYFTIPRELGTTLLRYVFWAFASCIAAFRYCRLVISINETHLYGKYRGVLMIAMATDANQKVFPWFLECLKISIGHVIPDEGICIIFDQDKGIKYVIAEWPRGDDGSLRIFHRYCL